MDHVYKVNKTQKLKLSDHSPAASGKGDQESSTPKLDALGKELAELQAELYAAQTHSVLIVLRVVDRTPSAAARALLN